VKAWKKIEQAIDSVTEGTGRVGWFLILFMMSFGLYDVTMRYLFTMPSQWIYITLQMAMVMLTAVAAGYAFLTFVKVDVLYSHFSPRGKAFADIFTFVFVLMVCVILIWKGIEHAQTSIATRQMTSTALRLPLYPVKTLIPLGGVLLLLMAVKKLVADIRTVFRKGTE